MQSNVLAPLLKTKYAAFQEHGVTTQSPDAILTWVTNHGRLSPKQMSWEELDLKKAAPD